MPVSHRPAARIAIASAIILAVAVVVCVFYIFDPMTSGIYPQCPSKLLTGYDCPGCGTSRALHALVHLRISQAWHYNAAVFFAIPLIALYLIGPKMPQGSLLNRLSYSSRLSAAIVVGVVLWTVLRNIFVPL